MKRIVSLILSAVVLALCFSSCNLSVSFNSYEDGDKYSIGDTRIKDTVSEIEIEWARGTITVLYKECDSISVSEKSNGKLSDDEKVHWYIDGNELKIEEYKSKLFTYNAPKKDLTVTVPADISLQKFSINCESADVSADTIIADEVVLSATSGSISAAVTARDINASSTSGKIDLKQNGEANSLEATSTSGKLNITLADTNEVDVQANSGVINLSCSKTPKELETKSTSGDVKISLPEDAGFTAEIETTSGTFNSDLPIISKGKTFVCGDGTSKFELESTSGNISIEIST